MKKMIRVLYTIHRCPYPPNKGDRIRSFNIIKYLSKRYDVKIIYPCFSRYDYKKKENLLKYCSYVECIKGSKIRSVLNCLLGLFYDKPLTHSYFKSRKIEESIKKIDFDVALVDCSSMAQFFVDKDIPKIIDFIDIDSEKWKSYAERSRSIKYYIYRREYYKLKKFEEEIVKKFDSCIVVSEGEKSLIKKDNVSVIKNGIDFDYFNNKKYPHIYDNEYIIFSGAMNYFPNIDGVIYFCKTIFPIIKNEIKNIKFVIAGMEPHRKVKRLESEDIIVTGFVRDIRAFISNASVCVVPLRIARGIQNKILEAMAMGVPVVSTSMANNGINAINGKEIFTTDDPEEFARLIIELINNKTLREQIVENAHLFVKQHFDWDHNLTDLNRMISLASTKNRQNDQG